MTGMNITADARWRKSTFSMGAGNCVEIAQLPGGLVAVRDSKNPDGPVLTFPVSEWRAFIQGVRNYETGH